MMGLLYDNVGRCDANVLHSLHELLLVEGTLTWLVGFIVARAATDIVIIAGYLQRLTTTFREEGLGASL